MALLIHVGSHPDELVGRLYQELAVPPADPFTPEVVAVPTRGVERWLTQRIAGEMSGRVPGGGICANLLTPSPAQPPTAVLCLRILMVRSLRATCLTMPAGMTRCPISGSGSPIGRPRPPTR